MSDIAIIKNPNKLLEEKINFFNEYFSFYTQYAGVFFETELENPLSLIEKIIFQLENNDNKEKACGYIFNYLNHSYFSEDIFLKNFDSYTPLIIQVKKFKLLEGNNLNRKREKWIKENKSFLINLKLLNVELSQLMFQRAFERILQMIICNHQLEEHLVEIKKMTKILVTEALFRGRSKIEVQGLFLRILSNDIKKFPFPKLVQSEDERKDYIEKRDFAKQFQGIINFLDEEPSDKFFICRIFGAVINDEVGIQYGLIEFLGSKNEKICSLEKEFSFVDELSKDFFSDSNHLFVVVPAKSFNENIIVEEILPLIQDATVFLEMVLDTFLFIDHESYLTTTDFITCAGKLKGNKGIKEITKIDIENLKDTPSIFLKNYDSPAKEHLLKHERTFLYAIHYNNLEEYWRYLENLFSLKVDQVILTVSSLILLNEKLIRNKKVTSYLFSSTYPWYFDYQLFGVKPEVFVELHNELGKYKTKRFFDTLDYPFFKEIKNFLQKKHTVNRYLLLEAYYRRVISELYETRNTITHKNIIQQRAKIKIQNSIPGIFSRVRWVIFDYIRKFPTLDFETLINKAIEDSSKLTKKNKEAR